MRWVLLLFFIICQKKVSCSSSEHAKPSHMTSDLVSITTINENNTFSTNDTSKYTLLTKEFVFYYTFTSDAKCVKCVYDNATIWEKGSDDLCPKSISVHSDLFIVFLQFETVIHMYSFKKDKNGQRKFSLIDETEIEGPYPNKMQFLLKNPSDPYNPKFESIDGVNHGFQFEYEFSDKECLEVKYGDISVWTHDSEKSESKLPKYVHLNMYSSMIVITMDTFSLIYNCSEKSCDFFIKSNLPEFTEHDLTFMTKGSDNQLTELDSSNFHLSKYHGDNAYFFVLNENTNCNHLKYKDTTMWEDKNNKLLVKSVYINLPNKIFIIETNKSLVFYTHIIQWILIFNAETEKDSEDLTEEQTPSGDQEKQRESEESSKSKETPKRKLNTMTLMLIMGGVILILLLLAVLVKFCIR